MIRMSPSSRVLREEDVSWGESDLDSFEEGEILMIRSCNNDGGDCGMFMMINEDLTPVIAPEKDSIIALHYSFFEGDGSSSDELRDYGMAVDDYEGPPIFDDDQYEEESMPVYDTDIEDVIEEEEGFI
ncbi:hypothetical protein Tco_1419174 [Tanacetum coccineum]